MMHREVRSATSNHNLAQGSQSECTAIRSGASAHSATIEKAGQSKQIHSNIRPRPMSPMIKIQTHCQPHSITRSHAKKALEMQALQG